MKRFPIHYLVPLIVTLIVGFPTLQLPYSLINDGVTIGNHRILTDSLKKGNWPVVTQVLCNKKIGRFFPAYHVVNSLSLGIFGESATAQRIIHLMRFAVAIFALYFLVYRVSGKKAAALIAILFFALCPFCYEKWFRMGAPEANIVALLSASLAMLYYSGDKKNWPHRLAFAGSLFCLPLIYFAKETSVAILPVIAVPVLLGHYSYKGSFVQRRFVSYMAVSAAICVTYFVIRYAIGYSISGGSYSSNYVSQGSGLVTIVLKNIAFYWKALYRTYWVFLILPFLYWLFLLTRGLMKRDAQRIPVQQRHVANVLIWSTTGLSLFLFQTLIYLPWKNSTPMYLLPSVFGFSLFLGIVGGEFLENMHRVSGQRPLRLLGKVLVICLVALFFLRVLVPNAVQMFNFAQRHQNHDLLHSRVISFLSEVTPVGGTVRTTIPPPEPLVETKIHLDVFHGRKDIGVRGMEWGENDSLYEGDIIALVRYSGNKRKHPWGSMDVFNNSALMPLEGMQESRRVLSENPVQWGVKWLFEKAGFGSGSRELMRPYDSVCELFKVVRPVSFSEFVPTRLNPQQSGSPAFSRGIWQGGWITIDNKIVLRLPDRSRKLVLKGQIPEWAKYHMPYAFDIESDSGWMGRVQVDVPGDFVWEYPIDKTGFVRDNRIVNFHIRSQQYVIPSAVIPGNRDNRKVLFKLIFFGFE